jgi:hypothetical protein
MQMPSPEINLDLGATVKQQFAPSSADSTPNRDKDKYPIDDIKDPTPCTLIFVKGTTSRTTEVAESTVMPSCILHGRPVRVECVVVKVTTIREGHELVCSKKDLLAISAMSDHEFLLDPLEPIFCVHGAFDL